MSTADLPGFLPVAQHHGCQCKAQLFLVGSGALGAPQSTHLVPVEQPEDTCAPDRCMALLELGSQDKKGRSPETWRW